jgi:hypothetical protein
LPVIIFHQIKRPELAFVEDAAQVFPDDAEEKKLDTTDEKDDGDERRIARHIFPTDEGAKNDKEHIQEGNKCQNTADGNGAMVKLVMPSMAKLRSFQ